MSTHTMVREDYDLLSRIRKYGFLVFNVLMAAWMVVAYLLGTSKDTGTAPLSEGPAFGIEVVLLFIGIIWIVGNIILALITWYLKSKTPDTMHTTHR